MVGKSSFVRVLGGVSAVLLLAAGIAAVPANAVRAPAVRQVLTHDVMPSARAAGVTDLGPIDADRVLQIAVRLSHPDPRGEIATYEAIYDPASPQFHRFLTSGELAARFGVGTARIQATRAFLADGGLEITADSPTGFSWLATGTAAQIEKLFDTSIHMFKDGDRTFYGNVTPPSVPAAIGASTVSLTDRFQLQTHDFPVSATTEPEDLWNIYNLPAIDANTGQGEQVALFGWGVSDGVEDDLKLFEAKHGIVPPAFNPVFRIQRVGADPDPTDTGAKREWNLDSQASLGMAPGLLQQVFYFATSDSFDGGIATLQAWIDDPEGARQGSASWGTCEGNPAFADVFSDYSTALNDTLRAATLLGRTLFASSGDTGSGCPGPRGGVNGVQISPLPEQTVPAASSYAVAVGGTVLTTKDGSSPQERDIEYAWTHGGGGSAAYEPKPPYQQGVAAINRPCLSSSAGEPNTDGHLCRGVPDVAAQSGDLLLSGYNTFVDGTETPTGGTSLSAPLWAGMWARVQAASAGVATSATPTTTPNGKPKKHQPPDAVTYAYPGLGFANETFYEIGADPTRYANAFTDITLGDNGLHQAGPGWDYTTGWGVPNIINLMTDLNGGVAPTHADATLPPPPPPPESDTGIDACKPLWSDDANDQRGTLSTPIGRQSPQDLLEGRMTDDGTTLRIAITVADFETTLPPGSLFANYYTYWEYGGTRYYAAASVDRNGNVTYVDGTADGAIDDTPVHTDLSGSVVTGPNGGIFIDVPLANVGSPPVGARLTPFLVSGDASGTVYSVAYLSSDPADLINSRADEDDRGQVYVVGQSCVGGVSTVPPDPTSTTQPTALASALKSVSVG